MPSLSSPRAELTLQLGTSAESPEVGVLIPSLKLCLNVCRWLYTVYLAIDANFRLRMKDRGVENDEELGPGWAYLVESKAYAAELPKHKQPVEVREKAVGSERP